jgi:hypothetical protein
MKMRSIRTLLFALVVLSMSAAAFAQIGISVSFGPPALPVYEQPLCPGDGYLWTPGYWGWGADFNDYYWVPGTWIEAPQVGFLWTPPYWGWGGSGYQFYEGYWGPTIGFYGGINYGFGYFGTGFEGGRWDGGHFFYNRAVMNVNVTNIHNVYNTTIVNRNDNHVSFNGGNGGINVRPTPEQEAAAHERHVGPVAAQTEHMNQARGDLQQRASTNQGRPPVAATMKAADFKGEGVVKTREAGGTYQRPASAGNPGGNAARPENNRTENNAAQNNNEAKAAQQKANHVKDLPAAEKPAPPNTGNPKLDKKYQQQQDKQYQKQTQERQKMQQQQEKEDQQAAKQQNQQRQQQVEQRHQQQTEQLQQRHQQQQQQMQQRMPQARPQAEPQPRAEPRPH